MPEYLTPGVYVEEVESGSKPIEGVGTNTCAFIGYSKSGDFHKPTFISSWTQFVELFGQDENKLIFGLASALDTTPEIVVKMKDASRKSWPDFTSKIIDGAIRNDKAKDKKGETLKDLRHFLKEYEIPQTPSPYIEGSYLAHAVNGFYLNGGSRAYIIRVPYGAPVPVTATQAGTEPSVSTKKLEAAKAMIGSFTFTSKEEGPVGNGVAIELETVGDAGEFKLKISKGDLTESYPAKGNGMKTTDVVTQLKTSRLVNVVTVEPLVLDIKPMTVKLEGGKEIAIAAPVSSDLAPAKNGMMDLAKFACAPISDMNIAPDEFIGDEASRTGIWGLGVLEDVNMVAVPDLMAGLWKRMNMDFGGETLIGDEELVGDFDARRQAILDNQCNVVAFCEKMADRIAILDPLPGLSAQAMRDTTSQTPYNCEKGHAAIYYPWIKVSDPLNKGKQLFVPPSGHMAGIYARVGAERGIHKAPANEMVRGAVALETYLTRGDQAILNPDGINAIRSFPGEGIKVYGARTLATVSNASWKYVNVRRIFDYIEKSVERATGWAVFEPNDPDLWGRLRRNISAFLLTCWREGMLFGAVPGEAFYVKCDASTNPLEMIDLGRVYVEIGVNPVKPAEFVIFRIGQWSGGTSVSEQA